MYDLATIGDIKLDVFIDLGRDARVLCSKDEHTCEMRIKYGQKIPVDSAVSMVAGSAANVAISLRKLGASSTVVSVMGDDSTAMLAKETLRSAGISTEYLRTEPGTQSSFSAILNFEGESTVLAVHHPHGFEIPEALNAARLFVCEMGKNYRDLFRALTLRAVEGQKIALNPGAIQLEERAPELINLIRVADVVFLNRTEAKALCHCPSDEPEALLRSVQELGPRLAIVTNGEHGAFATENKAIWHAPAFPAKRVEATGAGDAFSAGVLGAFIHGHDLATALAWGSVNAASVVEHVGPQAGLLTAQQITERLQQEGGYRVGIL